MVKGDSNMPILTFKYAQCKKGSEVFFPEECTCNNPNATNF